MACSHMESLFMKALDNNTTPQEDGALTAHLQICQSCREDFQAYTQMMDAFAEMEMEETPDGFVEAVMEKVATMPVLYTSQNHQLESLLCWLFGLFSLAAGGVMMAFMNGSEFDQSFASRFQHVSDGLAGAGASFDAWSGSLVFDINQMVSACVDVLATLWVIPLGIFGVLIVAQMMLYKKDKVGEY